MSNLCADPEALVEARIDEVLTQYRESPYLLNLIRAYLSKLAETSMSYCDMVEKFDLDTAVGDQLTIIGRILGFPRCHCVCDTIPVVGYDCGGSYAGSYQLAGYCEPGSSWIHCSPYGNSELCVDEDEIYRSLLKARRYQMLGLYDIESLHEALQIVWGEDAMVAETKVGQVVVTPGRSLTATETRYLPIVFRALPIAPGIKGMIHIDQGPIAGYGDGWAGYCGGDWLCPVDPHAYTCS
ncbi:baseplate wedge [Pseudanabaena phage Pam3]|uniref:Baseplate wedge n=1 Tax=Pseudanabaena phage Pam3 TaxID=2936519 RepID=A0ACD6BAN6_9CAUD|nr:Chain C, Pam3 baseplate wedge gp23 [uncultured cyanophage]7YFZ_D Chain D, Pam3 baseplate wedge gp23 [uncultured cyanophage]7YFZ_G Chain G, Pam3 baseplate wedge gp23 [uncultured cyanophage]7YFZ_J Chain J, Pam3 baseplate wedge gp23 [uncultured cyanophage]7YFZ_M Chain M, Pam3 baseplate wedge gp23 [uncultured cyanophage]7YFZ_S Chain S, Pam3 baseplate wedge gp23 [uncultured cyanophage]UQS95094.1 baseplate wedge [Pseudanabaena phage Pam3]